MTSLRSRRNAFTLVEVLIALALSVMLIFAVYSSITMYYRFNIAGRGEIAGQQFLRGLTQRIQKDLEGTILVLPEIEVESSTSSAADELTSSDSLSGSTGGLNNLNTAGETTTQLGFKGLLEAGIPQVFGLYGNAEMLHLCVSLPTRERSYYSYEDRETGAERISDLQIISYGLLTLDAITMGTMEKELQVSRPDKGLGRRTRDFFATDTVDETLAMEDLIAAEVTELSYLYFDGANWVDSWDSISMGTLPRAVEITFGMWNPPPRQLGQPPTQRAGTVTRVSHLFYLANSSPPMEVAQ